MMSLESDLMWSYSLFPEWWRQGEESGRLRIFFFEIFYCHGDEAISAGGPPSQKGFDKEPAECGYVGNLTGSHVVLAGIEGEMAGGSLSSFLLK